MQMHYHLPVTSNFNYVLQNARLKDEQLIHIKTLLRQAKEQEQELEQHEIFNSEHVEEGLKEKWEAARIEEEALDGTSFIRRYFFILFSQFFPPPTEANTSKHVIGDPNCPV